MFRIIAATLIGLVLSIGQGMANDRTQCEIDSIIAKHVMQERQNGTPIIVMMQKGRPNSWYTAVVEIAYSEPSYPMQSVRDWMAEEFGNMAYLSCLKVQRERLNQ